MRHDRVEIGKFRRPWQRRRKTGGIGDQRRRIARAARLHHPLDLSAARPVHRIEHIEHRESAPIAAIHRQRAPRLCDHRLERQDMRRCQIADMDIVAHSGAVGGVVIAAIDRDPLASAQRRLAGDLDQMRRARSGLSCAPLRIGARDVEVAQHANIEPMRRARIGEHLLGHQLGPAIGIDRLARRVFGHA